MTVTDESVEIGPDDCVTLANCRLQQLAVANVQLTAPVFNSLHVL
jgi:hypothetical protein